MAISENEAKDILRIIGWSRAEEGDIEACEAIDMAMNVLEEIQQYRAIGTVEECRIAMERMKPKKPNIEKRKITDCYGIPHDLDVKICPACYKQLEEIRFRKYPCECGQVIDWSE